MSHFQMRTTSTALLEKVMETEEKVLKKFQFLLKVGIATFDR